MQKLKSYQELNEGLFFNKFNKVYQKIKSELGLDLYFSATFGMAITALFPFFDKLVKTSEFTNTLSSNDVVLLTVCALAVILKESKSDIDKLKSMVQEKEVGGYLGLFTKAINNLGKLFSTITTNIGKGVQGVIDMFSYTALFVPFLVGFLDVINLYKIDFDNFDEVMTNPKGAVISTSIGALTISLKHIINMILKKIKRSNKNKKTPQSDDHSVAQKFESVEKIFENYFL